MTKKTQTKMIIRKQNSNFVGGHFFLQNVLFPIFSFFFSLNYLPKGNSVRFLSAVRFPGKHLSNQWSESSSSGDIVQTPNTQSLLENQNKKPSIKIKLQVLQGGNLTISFNQENKLLRSFFEISLHK